MSGTGDSAAAPVPPHTAKCTPTAPRTHVRASELDGARSGQHEAEPSSPTWGPEAEGCTRLLWAAPAHPWGPPSGRIAPLPPLRILGDAFRPWLRAWRDTPRHFTGVLPSAPAPAPTRAPLERLLAVRNENDPPQATLQRRALRLLEAATKQRASLRDPLAGQGPWGGLSGEAKLSTRPLNRFRNV